MATPEPNSYESDLVRRIAGKHDFRKMTDAQIVEVMKGKFTDLYDEGKMDSAILDYVNQHELPPITKKGFSFDEDGKNAIVERNALLKLLRAQEKREEKIRGRHAGTAFKTSKLNTDTATTFSPPKVKVMSKSPTVMQKAEHQLRKIQKNIELGSMLKSPSKQSGITKDDSKTKISSQVMEGVTMATGANQSNGSSSQDRAMQMSKSPSSPLLSKLMPPLKQQHMKKMMILPTPNLNRGYSPLNKQTMVVEMRETFTGDGKR